MLYLATIFIFDGAFFPSKVLTNDNHHACGRHRDAKHAGLTVIGSAAGLERVKCLGRADFAFNHSDPQYLK